MSASYSTFTKPVIGTLIALMVVGCGTATAPVKPTSSTVQYDRLARDVFNETNRLRSGPKAYLHVLNDMGGRMTGKVYRPRDSEVGILTNEGVSAVNEAVNVLRRQQPLGKLAWSDALAELARNHVADTGPKGLVSHESSAGRSFKERVSGALGQHGFSTAAENLSYGSSKGVEVVAQLFIDDGVAGRGHRINLLKGQLTHAGVACGYHREYGHMCAAIYAAK